MRNKNSTAPLMAALTNGWKVAQPLRTTEPELDGEEPRYVVRLQNQRGQSQHLLLPMSKKVGSLLRQQGLSIR